MRIKDRADASSDRAFWIWRIVHGEEIAVLYRAVHIAERDIASVSGEQCASPGAELGGDESGFRELAEDAADDGGVGVDGDRDVIGRHRSVRERVEEREDVYGDGRAGGEVHM